MLYAAVLICLTWVAHTTFKRRGSYAIKFPVSLYFPVVHEGFDVRKKPEVLFFLEGFEIILSLIYYVCRQGHLYRGGQGLHQETTNQKFFFTKESIQL